ncbi:asparagine synthetase A [Micromonospora sp. NPDC002296]|uniref:asparagine synthetase A n=1 Tax=Micromonospora sp. NPDC002296 TaxID=3154271 RepID=UPI003326B0BC
MYLPDRPAAPVSLPAPWEHLARRRTRAVMRVQGGVLTATRRLLAQEGFVEILPPIIGPVTDPGIRGSKQIDVDYYGHRYRLMTSAILYKQAALLSHDKIFCVASNVRLEPPETASTQRHLAEFHQIDVEMAGASRAEAMELAERVVVNATEHVVGTMLVDLEELGRDVAGLAAMSTESFTHVSHAEAVKMLHNEGYRQAETSELSWEGEAALSAIIGKPFFVTDYPKGSRGFYDRESRESPGVLRNFDLIAGEGYGELASGGEREADYARIVMRMRETAENPSKYGWYLEMMRRGVPASAGFGIGLERLVRYICGLESTWEASAFPKLPGIVSP